MQVREEGGTSTFVLLLASLYQAQPSHPPPPPSLCTFLSALDAFCLLEVYEYLSALALDTDPTFDTTPTAASTQHSAAAVLEEDKMAAMRQAHENAKGLPLVTNPPRKEGPPVRPRDLCVVADHMFQGLGKQLRLCGVDARVLPSDASSYELVKVSISEERIILTSGKSFYWARNRVPEHLCYFVAAKKPMDQVKEVLEYYNVRVTADDIMSRCQVGLSGTTMRGGTRLCGRRGRSEVGGGAEGGCVGGGAGWG